MSNDRADREFIVNWLAGWLAGKQIGNLAFARFPMCVCGLVLVLVWVRHKLVGDVLAERVEKIM